jgi:serine/threonine-protein kinase
MYLRDQNVISANEADSVLIASATRSPRTGFRDRGLLRGVMMMFSLLLVGIVLVGGVIQASAGRFTRDERETFESASFSLGNAGFLRVVAEPWADVFVDGELVVTTPSAARIPLPPGTHYIKFVNPFYQEHTLSVQIRTAETNAVHVVLVPKQTAAARAP